MRKFIYPFVALLVLSCDEEIDVSLPIEDAPIVIDAWLYHKSETQTISVTRANTYFNNDEASGLSGAIVTVTDLADVGNPILFTEGDPGQYNWNPTNPTDSFGIIGQDYRLEILLDGTTYTSYSSLNPVPKLDSITWRLEPATAFFDDSFFGEFWSQDLEGQEDFYWIKTWKNSALLAKPSEINISYDAAFSEEGNTDGYTFIQPIRDAMNPFESDDDDQLIPPYELGDSAFVEINSITLDAFFFLQQVQIQTDRQGGFAELFATPLANIQSNILSTNKSEKVVGFFCTSASSGLGRKFTEEAILED
ncbi:MAG: DUF4249 domain-containing protein [Cytophagales bacterium]|nr:DUF4249 domain-containing protein [Cytophagales bacterium]